MIYVPSVLQLSLQAVHLLISASIFSTVMLEVLETIINLFNNNELFHLRHGTEQLFPLHHGSDVGRGFAKLPPVVRQYLGVSLQGMMNGRRSTTARGSFSDIQSLSPIL